MEIDLQRAKASAEPFRSQVCIIGAGIAGLTLAYTLNQRGIGVALLEAGGRSLDARAEKIFAAAHLSGEKHEGTLHGRFRVFGGSSLRWGGQLLATQQDAGTGWPISYEELAPFLAEAERLLGVHDLPYDAASFFSRIKQDKPALLSGLPELNASLSKWIPFSKRNLAKTLGRELVSSSKAVLYLNAQATEIELDPSGGSVQGVVVRDAAGRSFRFAAKQFVLAAGTVETSRLLLASRSVAAEGVGNRHGQVGCNFHDHLTMPVATITGASRDAVLGALRPWIFDGVMRSAKLEASPELRERLRLNPVLAHVTIEEPEDSGVGVIRRVLLARQDGGRRFAGITRLPEAAMQAMRLVWWAKVRHRRFVSAKAVVKLYLNVAQDAPSLSRVSLSDDDMDGEGVPQAVLEWRISEAERSTLLKFASYLREQINALGLKGFEWSDELEQNTPLKSLTDARHAMGGACMGSDPRDSVVDAELTVHGIENLSVASAAVFPDGSLQLPTLPLVALTVRLADRLTTLLAK